MRLQGSAPTGPAALSAQLLLHVDARHARALDLEHRIGSLHGGADADIVVLDSRAKPAMELRMQVASTLAEELFILQTMGDDRSVAEVYVAGRPMKSGRRETKAEAVRALATV